MKKIVAIIVALLGIATLQAKVICGADCTSEWRGLLKGKRVALLANHTATTEGKHILDKMLEEHINVVAVVAPEHGFRGKADAGEHINSSVDSQTGLPIWSLYSAKSRRLTPEGGAIRCHSGRYAGCGIAILHLLHHDALGDA